MDRASWVRRRDIRLNADCHCLPTNMMIGRMNATSILGSPTPGVAGAKAAGQPHPMALIEGMLVSAFHHALQV